MSKIQEKNGLKQFGFWSNKTGKSPKHSAQSILGVSSKNAEKSLLQRTSRGTNAQTDAKAVATAHPNIFLQSHFNQKQKEDALSKVCPLFKNLAWEAIK